MTDDSRAGPRGLLWVAGLVVAVGAGATTAHGLYEVAVAARVPVAVAWLYPVITDGLALVAYASTARLAGRPGSRYAWTVVVVAAGLSGLAQATYLAGAVTGHASIGLRFGIGAWPAIAAATVAHLLYLIGTAVPARADVPDAPVPVHPGDPVPVRPAEPRTGTPVPAPAPPPTIKPPGRTVAGARRSSPRPGRAARSDDELLARLTARGESMSVRAAARVLGTGPDRARRLLRQAGLLADTGEPQDQPSLHLVPDATGQHLTDDRTTDDNNQKTSDQTDHESRDQP